MAQVTISGLDHIIRILQQHPQLMGLASFSSVKEVAKKAQDAVKRSGCGCSAGPIYAAYKNVFERSLDLLGHGDHLVAKNVLGVDKICYYSRDISGKNTLKCI